MFIFMLVVPGISKGQTSVCDNGGFEDDFQYYSGFYASYSTGSNACTPLDNNGMPIVWNSSSLPAFRRFEIVSSGTDALVGINKTKFGGKALLLNNKYGHFQGVDCSTHSDLNKITRQFTVTEENRNFTVWFAVVLENPSGHNDQQPYFSIYCDKAPETELCFDASKLNCAQNYLDQCVFDPIQVVNWTCTKIKIPKSEIGSLATLEISMADCGRGEHFGYAYVDGICETCQNSSLGTVNLTDAPFNNSGIGLLPKSCNGDTLTICGDFTLPSFCGAWEVEYIEAPGFTVTNLVVNNSNHTFCFDIAKSNFPGTLCREFYVILHFRTLTGARISQPSNSIEICPSDFEQYDVNMTVGGCNNNGTIELISDDYYYVNLNFDVNVNSSWTLERQLLNPYPGESGHYTLNTGVGDYAGSLGPFLIQEGSWTLTINIDGCIYTYTINPPDFCPVCAPLAKAKIRNITCDNNGTPNIVGDDKWAFEIFVDGDPTKNYSIDLNSYSYGNPHIIQGGNITEGCKEFTVVDEISSCKVKIIVCPPKQCSSLCDLEAYIKNLSCNTEGGSYSVNLAVSGSGNKCYRSVDIDGPSGIGNPNNQQGSLPNVPVGPFTDNIYLTIYDCNNPSCFKIIYVPILPCPQGIQIGNHGVLGTDNIVLDLQVVPNPFIAGQVLIKSKLACTDFDIFDSQGKHIYKGNFIGTEYNLTFNKPSGLYYLKYRNAEGNNKVIKLICM